MVSDLQLFTRFYALALAGILHIFDSFMPKHLKSFIYPLRYYLLINLHFISYYFGSQILSTYIREWNGFVILDSHHRPDRLC